ncbi:MULTISPECIES: DUF6173 family protein [Bacillaceae]|uniref:Uncharacterized protein n=1 Tax=Domibacillus aminovorans TaxID=29332 RepID=A0A177L5A0_9BACI|nr:MULTISPECIES: DUF6173 family protein [Bacillaceae]OAH57751.1 hypothetical protein AWH48_01660 [Domibacillus aminovorans]OAH60472.1 hypothetical protein AWH49_16560 [Domibacillus aminovorans]
MESKPDLLKSMDDNEICNELPIPTNTPGQNLASELYKHLKKRAEDFDNKLDGSQGVGVKLIPSGQSVTFQVTALGYCDPSLIIFAGVTDSGLEVQLIQHVSQLNFLLMAMPRPNPKEPKIPLGFIQ